MSVPKGGGSAGGGRRRGKGAEEEALPSPLPSTPPSAPPSLRPWAAKKAKGKPKAKRQRYEYEVAPDVQKDLEEIVRLLPDEFPHVDTRRVICYRSRGSTARIYARIWSLPGIFSHALGIEPHYVIEVVERYDRSPRDEREKTLLHELLHIPKTFSGALVPHKCFGKEINCAREGELHRKLEISRAIEARAQLAARALRSPTLDQYG